MNSDRYKAGIERKFHSLKRGKKSSIPASFSAKLPSGKNMRMYVVTAKHTINDSIIALLAAWRDKGNVWFPSQFIVTHEGTKKWAQAQLLDMPDRILFFMHLVGSKAPFGHLGLYRFDYGQKSCEIDNVIRGSDESGTKGAVTVAVKLLCDWTFQYLGVQTLYLRVFSDNTKALAVYERVGFREIERVPLIKKIDHGVVTWIESEKQKKVKRYFVKMKLSRPS